MTPYPLLITSDAEADIEDAVAWYQSISAGLDAEFTRVLEACFWAIRRNPDIYPVVHKNVHRALLRKFPYAIFYFVFDDTVVILACFHMKRDPQDWQSRV
jgi:toxin ParE1/3/4